MMFVKKGLSVAARAVRDEWCSLYKGESQEDRARIMTN